MHIITMIFLLSILVLVHELGHFWAAKAVGVKPEKFGFGLPFGPTLYETKWGDTTICVHAFLLGGYVSFPDDDPDSPLPKDDPSRLSNKKLWERFVIISAGVFANAVIAYILVLFVAFGSGKLPSGQYNVLIGGLQADKTLAAHYIGIKPKDEIVSANGSKIDTPFKFIEIARRSKKFDGYVSQARVSVQEEKIDKLNPKLSNKAVIPAGVKVILPAYSVEEPLNYTDDSLVGKTEFKPEGNKLTYQQKQLRDKIEDENIFVSDGKVTLLDLAYASADTVHPVNIVVRRDGKVLSLIPAYPSKEGFIGLQLSAKEVEVPTKGIIASVDGSSKYLYRNVGFMIWGLKQLVTGAIPLDNVHGVIAVTKVGGEMIEKNGMWDGLLLTALISMNLAIMNLLPIPALDGGHLFFLFLEKLMGRPVNEKVQETVSRYGFVLVLGLMVLVVFNDIWALVTDKL